MKPDRIQFGTRKNTASSRQHDLRLAVNSLPLQSKTLSPNSHEDESSPPPASPAPETLGPLTGTTGRGGGEGGQLLTVHEVAHLLHVPVSWVYGRTRKRSRNRLPGIRLGKYWRFREADVVEWVGRQQA